VKRLHLIVSDEVAAELRNSVGIKGLTGNAYGTSDAALSKISKALSDGDRVCTLDYKDRPDPEIAAMHAKEKQCIADGGHYPDNQGHCHTCGAYIY